MLVVRKMVFVSLISRLTEYLRLRTISIKIILYCIIKFKEVIVMAGNINTQREAEARAKGQ